MDSHYKIKFGTDGWRAIIAESYTVDNLRRVSWATAKWMKSKSFNSVVIGFDCRFGGAMFLEECLKIFAQEGIFVYASPTFVSTPMVSLGVIKLKADMGVVITASHNPPEYNGFKLKSSYGGPTPPHEILEIENLIPDQLSIIDTRIDQWAESFKWVDLESDYLDHVKANFDVFALSQNSHLAYDAMYGAGQNVMKALFPQMKAFHCEWNPGFNNTPPEPISKNLSEMTHFLKTNPSKYIGIANDGDADRIAMMDPQGEIIDSHHILLLLLRYLIEYKELKGDVAVSFSVTNKMKKLADHYGLKTHITKIGFKYLAELMLNQDILVAGEESGGLAVKSHIPERDGIWIGLTILDYMAVSGKSINQLISEIYDIVGPFAYDRLDLKLWPEQLNQIKNKLNDHHWTKWGKFEILHTESLDGHKYYFQHDNWLMFRLSGTEPVLRIYAQGRSKEECRDILSAACFELKISE